MLGFTGAELFAIIGTSIVQMYCIKSLIDNELVIWLESKELLELIFICILVSLSKMGLMEKNGW